MPNLAEAAALVPDAPGPTIGSEAPETAPKDKGGSESPPETPPAKDPVVEARELSHAEAKARLEAIQERRRAARAKVDLDGRTQRLTEHEQRLRSMYQELQAKEQKLQEYDTKWKAALKDPLKLRDLGVDPLDTYKKLTHAAAEADTPEGHAARLRDEFAEMLSSKDKALAELKEEIAAFKKMSEEKELTAAQERELHVAQERTKQFFSVLKLDKYQELTDMYEDEELVHMANAWWQGSGTKGPINPEGAADAVLKWFESKDQRRAARRKEREAARGTAQETASASMERKPETIGNGLAASSASLQQRTKTRAQLMKEAEAELGVLLDRKR